MCIDGGSSYLLMREVQHLLRDPSFVLAWRARRGGIDCGVLLDSYLSDTVSGSRARGRGMVLD